MPDLFTKETCFEKFQTFLEHMKNAASKQNNTTIISRGHQKKSQPYIFTHDPKFINLFDI